MPEATTLVPDEKVARVIALAADYVAGELGRQTKPESFDFATMLVIKAEAAALRYPGEDRHPAFRQLGRRAGLESEEWNRAVIQASQAMTRSTAQIDLLLTADRHAAQAGLVVRRNDCLS